MKSKFITLVAALVAVFSVGTATAATPKKGDTKSDPKAETKADPKDDAAKRDTYPLYGKVVAITSKTLTIKGGEGKEDRKASITADTKFTNGEKAATIDDVKVGAWVGGLLKKPTGDGNPTVVSINVGVKQKEDKPEDKEAPKTDSKAKSKTKK